LSMLNLSIKTFWTNPDYATGKKAELILKL
jgi:hypothetical protein